MTSSIMTFRERYVVGRKVAIAIGFVMLGLLWFMQVSVYQGNTGSLRPALINKEMTKINFQLNPDEFWALKIAGYRPKGDGKAMTLSSVALEQNNKHEIIEDIGTPVVTTHPEALEWFRYSEDTTNKRICKAQNRLLIAQYSNQGEFAEIFEKTRPINMAYAERWCHDIVFLHAQTLSLSEANPATLLQLGWENREQYDQLLLLDADAMMNNFRYDITKLFPEHEMLVAQRIEGRDEIRTWKVFGTVSLWNLKHLLTPRIQVTWSSRFEENDSMVGLGEQIKPYAETEVFTVTREFGHFDSSYIRTMQFATKNHGIRKIDPKTRVDRWAKETARNCKKLHLDCSSTLSKNR